MIKTPSIKVKISAIERGVGKTTLSMMIVKFLRDSGYMVEYQGRNFNNSVLIEESIERGFEPLPKSVIVKLEDLS